LQRERTSRRRVFKYKATWKGFKKKEMNEQVESSLIIQVR